MDENNNSVSELKNRIRHLEFTVESLSYYLALPHDVLGEIRKAGMTVTQIKVPPEADSPRALR